MPGPGKGYIGKDDPRRKQWERLQGTAAGGSNPQASAAAYNPSYDPATGTIANPSGRGRVSTAQKVSRLRRRLRRGSKASGKANAGVASSTSATAAIETFADKAAKSSPLLRGITQSPVNRGGAGAAAEAVKGTARVGKVLGKTYWERTPTKGPLSSPATRAILTGPTALGLIGNKGKDRPPYNSLERRAAKVEQQANRARQTTQQQFKVQQAKVRQEKASPFGRSFFKPSKNERRLQRNAEALDASFKQSENARARKNMVLAAGEMRGVTRNNNRPDTKAPSNTREAISWFNKTRDRFSGIGTKAPKKGGRTPQEVLRGIQGTEINNANISASNLEVARGGWKKAGGAPSGDQLARAIPQDRRPITQKELLQNEGLLKENLKLYSKDSFKRVEKTAAGAPHRNPWALSEAQAPANETAEEKAAREDAVLMRMLGKNPGSGLKTLDAQEQARIKDDPDTLLEELTGISAAKRVGADFVKYWDNLSNARTFNEFMERARNVPIFNEKVAGVSVNPFDIPAPYGPGALTKIRIGSDEGLKEKDKPDYEASYGDALNLAITVGSLGWLRRGAMGFAKRVNTIGEAEDLRKPSAFILAASETRTGRIYNKALNILRSKPARVVHRGAGLGAIATTAATGDLEPFLKGTLTANMPQSTKTTARALLSAITAPLAFAGNLALTGRRAIGGIGADDPYLSSRDYILNPVDRLWEETVKEMERMWETYTSKDVARIREATEEDMGYIAMMSAFWLTRPGTTWFLKSTAKKIAKSPAGQAVVKKWWEDTQLQETYNNEVKRRVDNFKLTGRTLARTGVIQTAKDVQWKTMSDNVVMATQKFNQREAKRPSIGPRINRALDDIHKQQVAEARKNGYEIPDRMNVVTLANTLATRGVNPQKTTIEKLTAERDNLPEASQTYDALDFIIHNREILTDERFIQIWQGLQNNDELIDSVRNNTVDERQKERDREVKELELLVTYAHRTGQPLEDIPLRPSEEVMEAETAKKERLDEVRDELDKAKRESQKLQRDLRATKAEADSLVMVERLEAKDDAEIQKVNAERETVIDELLKLEYNATARKVELEDIATERRALYREYQRLTGQAYEAGRDSGRAQGRNAEENRRRQMGRGPLASTRRERLRGQKGKRNRGRIKESAAGVTARLKELDGRERELLAEVEATTKAAERLRGLEAQVSQIFRRKNPKHQREITRLQDRMTRLQREIERVDAGERPRLRKELAALERRVEGKLTPDELRLVYMTIANDPDLKNDDFLNLSRKEQERVISERVERLRDERQTLSNVLVRIQDNEKLSTLLDEIESEIESPELRVMREEAERMKRWPEPFVQAQGRFLKAELDERLAVLVERAQLLDTIYQGRERLRYRKKAEEQIREVLNRKSVEIKALKRKREAVRFAMLTQANPNAIKRAMFAQARQQVVQELRFEDLAALTEVWRENIAHILETEEDLMMPTYIAHTDVEKPDSVPPMITKDRGLGNKKEQRRKGDLAKRALADRSWEQQKRTYETALQVEGNRKTTQWVAMEGVVGVKINGKYVTSVREDQLPAFTRAYFEETGMSLSKVAARVEASWLASPNDFAALVETVGSIPRHLRKKEDQIEQALENKTGDPDSPGTYRFEVPPEEARFYGDERDQLEAVEGTAERIDARDRAAGRRYVFINRDVLRLLYQQTKVLEGWEKKIYEFNRVSSRIVLGSSLSWMLAQPIAEMLVLGAQHPIKMWPRLAEAHEINEAGGKDWLALTTLSRTVPGADPVINQRDKPLTMTEDQRAYQNLMGVMKKTPGSMFLDELIITRRNAALRGFAKLETFSTFDKWKGAWIREAGFLAELDSNLHGMRRAAKAVRGQMDVIEEAAGKLANMTRSEQLQWLTSDEGIDVGMRLVQHVDDQLGNWTDLRPGVEQTIGQVVFFYPFLRFSLNWMLRTYPRDHPVAWTAANLLGVANAEMLQRLIDYEPFWPSEWAVVPIFGGRGQNAPPTSLIPVARFNSGGNVLVEMTLNQTVAVDDTALYKLLPPLLSQGAQFWFEKDAFGQPLRDANDPFGENDPSWRTRLGAQADSLLNLFAPYRQLNEMAARKGLFTKEGSKFTFQGLLDRSAPSTTFWDPVGEDPNDWRNLLRQAAFAGIPIPASTVGDENGARKLRDRIKQIEATENDQYLYNGQERIIVNGKSYDFNDWAEEQLEDRKELQEEGGVYERRSPYHRSIVKEYLRQMKANRAASRALPGAYNDLFRYYMGRAVTINGTTYQREGGVPLPQDHWLRTKVVDRARASTDRIKTEYEAEFGGGVFPGTKEAARLLQSTDQAGGVGGADLTPAIGKAKPKAAKISEQDRIDTTDRLRQETRKRLEAKGMRKVNLADPMLDPQTTIKQVGKQRIVTKYRGAEVMGNARLSEFVAAEKSNRLAIDPETKLLMVPRVEKEVEAIRGVAANVDLVAANLNKQRAKIDKLLVKAGGVPSGVPEKYRSSIRKWGAWLEKEMKKNGLVQPYNTAIMDGYGVLPKGMSGAEYLAKILQAESGWDESIYTKENTSSAGAMGLGQFIPGTRASVLENYGVDAYGDADQQIHAAAILLSKGGMENYNSLFPNSSHDPVGKGGYHYYYEQDVGDIVVTNNAAMKQAKKEQKKAKAIESQLQQEVKAFEKVAKEARKKGLPVPNPMGPNGGGSANGEPQPYKGKFMGSRRAVSLLLGQPVWNDHMPFPGGTGGSDETDASHSTDGFHDLSNSYAQDIGSAGGRPEEGEEGLGRDQATMDKIVAGLRKMGGDVPDLQVGQDYRATLPNGYEVELLTSSGSGHGDHLHIGMKWVGKGAAASGSVSGSGGGGYSGGSGGGGSVGGGGGTGGGMGGIGAGSGLSAEQAVQQSIKDIQALEVSGEGQDYEDAGVESGVTAVAEASDKSASGDGVKSVTEQMASLPSIGSKKKKVPRFPSNPI